MDDGVKKDWREGGGGEKKKSVETEPVQRGHRAWGLVGVGGGEAGQKTKKLVETEGRDPTRRG